jgi:diguanylate cyclase (GGDEF)-like protein
MTPEETNTDSPGSDSSLSQVVRSLKIARGLNRQRTGENIELIERINAYEKSDTDNDDFRKAEAQRVSLLDPLTELANHRAFAKELRAELKRCQRYNYDVSLCMLSVDHFEDVIGHYGQLTGDSLLKVVANILRTAIYERDMAAIYARPVFAVLMPNTPLAIAAFNANRFREKIGTHVFAHNGENFSVTASLGLASCPEHAEQHDRLIACATEVMDRAAEFGGDRVIIY